MQAIDDTDALDQVVRVTAVLQAYKIHLVRMVLAQDGVVKHDAAIGIGFNLILGLPPGNRRRYVVIVQIAIDGVMREMLMMISEEVCV
ncbi:hypothetical protein D5047_05580 [Verminephrobacter eiseniae]|uniref:hypothetical protein n=1 Tax=Verminephrobacter eiseniae TaxID=364317 RepID=UPI002238C4A8|nr:hypothetical protein [Verminephrobacter eiseniae]MCW5235798.1 hypothetical protein [Verminephrobacter eiseniae]